MKDDRILKPRLRLCPFCGASGAPELRKSGGVAFVHCNACRADGPVFDIDEYISNEFHDMSGADQDEEWRNATIAAQHDAMKAWNRRPWEGQYFQEELDDLYQYVRRDEEAEANARNALKLESGALYGASCSEEAAECGH